MYGSLEKGIGYEWTITRYCGHVVPYRRRETRRYFVDVDEDEGSHF